MQTRYISSAVLAVMVLVGLSASAQSGAVCYNCFKNPSTCCWECITDTFGGTGCPSVSCNSCTVVGACGEASGCFVGDVAIATPEGFLPIKEVEVGDIVLSRSGTGSLVQGTVADVHLSESWSYLEINGKLRVTETHPLYSAGNWIDAGDLRIGDELTTLSGEVVAVVSIERFYKGVRVYNISVEGHQTFFAGGIFVHNKAAKMQD